MNAIKKQNMEDIVILTSIMASPIEMWRDQWFRNGKLKMISRPSVNFAHHISRTIREMHDAERVVRLDLWWKVKESNPRISYAKFMEIFERLMNQAYFGLKEDLYYYGKEREAIIHK